MLIDKSLKLLVLVLALAYCSGCDWFRKRKCEWYLIADPDKAMLAKPGYASVCIRNYKLNRQKCNMIIKLTEAEKVYSKEFRLSDTEINDDKFPKEIISIAPCKK